MSAPKSLSNADSQAYWDAAREGRVVFKTCRDCGHVQFPPRHVCPKCWSDRLEWREKPGRGHVHSFTVVHRAPLPEFDVPYVLAMVDLVDGPRMMTNIVGPGAVDVQLGDAVDMILEERGGHVLPVFRRAAWQQGASG